MAAAVADYRLPAGASGKLPRRADRLVLELEPTPDLVAACAARRRPDQFIVAFALEEPSNSSGEPARRCGPRAWTRLWPTRWRPWAAARQRRRVRADGRTFAPGAQIAQKQAFARWLIRWIQTRHNPADAGR